MTTGVAGQRAKPRVERRIRGSAQGIGNEQCATRNSRIATRIEEHGRVRRVRGVSRYRDSNELPCRLLERPIELDVEPSRDRGKHADAEQRENDEEGPGIPRRETPAQPIERIRE